MGSPRPRTNTRHEVLPAVAEDRTPLLQKKKPANDFCVDCSPEPTIHAILQYWPVLLVLPPLAADSFARGSLIIGYGLV